LAGEALANVITSLMETPDEFGAKFSSRVLPVEIVLAWLA
jgi:hypothetical protein